MNLLVTGGAGFIGSNLIHHVIDDARIAKLVNLDCLTYAGHLANLEKVSKHPKYIFEKVDLRDKAATLRVVEQHAITHVMHLAAESHVDRSITGPGDFISTNILGTFNVFEAARRHGAGPIVYASSNHATGFYTREDRMDGQAAHKPDSLYGLSKAFGEDLASLYCDKYGLDIACLRIGTAAPVPKEPRHLSTWHSYPDLLRLIEACFATPKLGFTVLYGVSNNTRRWWRNDHAPHVAYAPQDNAEYAAAEMLRDGDERDPEDPAVKYQGGPFVAEGYVKR